MKYSLFSHRNHQSKIVQKIEGEWFKMSSSRNSDPYVIEDYLDVFEGHSKHLLNYVVNMTDCNGNTAMHYAISYSNFDAASVLLDSKVCDVNKLNKVSTHWLCEYFANRYM